MSWWFHPVTKPKGNRMEKLDLEPLKAARDVMMVSSPSEDESFVIVNVLVPVVDPAEMVMVVPFIAE